MVKFESRYTTDNKDGNEYEHLTRIVFQGAVKKEYRWCRMVGDRNWVYCAITTFKAYEVSRELDAKCHWQVENFTPVKGARMKDEPFRKYDYRNLP